MSSNWLTIVVSDKKHNYETFYHTNKTDKDISTCKKDESFSISCFSVIIILKSTVRFESGIDTYKTGSVTLWSFLVKERHIEAT